MLKHTPCLCLWVIVPQLYGKLCRNVDLLALRNTRDNGLDVFRECWMHFLSCVYTRPPCVSSFNFDKENVRGQASLNSSTCGLSFIIVTPIFKLSLFLVFFIIPVFTDIGSHSQGQSICSPATRSFRGAAVALRLPNRNRGPTACQDTLLRLHTSKEPCVHRLVRFLLNASHGFAGACKVADVDGYLPMGYLIGNPNSRNESNS